MKFCRSLARAARPRVVARRSSTVAESAVKGEEPSNVWGKRAAVAAAVVGVGLGSVAYTVRRYESDAEFRRWMRADLAYVARRLDTFLEEYMPASAQSIRIEEDALEAPTIPGPRPQSTRVNPGAAPAPDQGLTEPKLFTRFTPQAAPLGPTPSLAAAASDRTAQLPPAVEVSAPAASNTETSHQPEPATTGAEKAAAATSRLLSGVAAAAEAAAEDSGNADDGAEEDAPDGRVSPNGCLWSAVREDEAAIWASAAPPETAAQLLVPAAAAQRYDEAMALFDRRAAALGVSVDEVDLPSAAEGKVAATPAGGPSATEAWVLISLPEAFQDCRWGSELLAEGTGGGSAVREMRLQWLRVQEAYAIAELEALTPRIAAMQRQSGRGLAMMRMDHRRRQLQWKLYALDADKGRVKTGKPLEL